LGVDRPRAFGRVVAPRRDKSPLHRLGDPAFFRVLHYHRQPLAGCHVVVVLGYKLGLRRQVEPRTQVLCFIERIPTAHTTHFTLKGQPMRETINEEVSLVMYYSAKKREALPCLIRWQSKDYPVV